MTDEELRELASELETIGAYTPTLNDMLDHLATPGSELYFNGDPFKFSGGVHFRILGTNGGDLKFQPVAGWENPDSVLSSPRWESAVKELKGFILEVHKWFSSGEKFDFLHHKSPGDHSEGITRELRSLFFGRPLEARVVYRWGEYEVIITLPPEEARLQHEIAREHILLHMQNQKIQDWETNFPLDSTQRLDIFTGGVQ